MSDSFCFPNVTGLNSYSLSALTSMQNSHFHNMNQEELLKHFVGAFPALSLLQQNSAAGDASNINHMVFFLRRRKV